MESDRYILITPRLCLSALSLCKKTPGLRVPTPRCRQCCQAAAVLVGRCEQHHSAASIGRATATGTRGHLLHVVATSFVYVAGGT